jgi:hypothetical protein
VLRLAEQPPTEARSARIYLHQLAARFPARASGYPEDWNTKVTSPQLDIGECRVLGSTAHLWLVRADDGSRLAAVYTKARSAGLIHS